MIPPISMTAGLTMILCVILPEESGGTMVPGAEKGRD